MPFIIFISSIWFMVKIRNNKELLTLKIYGFSNIKIFFILALYSFLLGWIVLLFINPVTSSLVEYYEKTKSNYARDIDHLVSFNKNGLWIKESLDSGERIVTASKLDGQKIYDIEIFELNENFNMRRKIISESANIKENNWTLYDAKIIEYGNETIKELNKEELTINSIYNYEKIVNLFNNSDTFSFVDILFNFQSMIKKGYSEEFLKQTSHSMMTLPFYLFIMTALVQY